MNGSKNSNLENNGINNNEQDTQQLQDQRNAQNNANNIRNAADVAIASKNPYAMAAGGADKVADKVTGGKATEVIGSTVAKGLKRTPGGKNLQNASNKISESGVSNAAGKAASVNNSKTTSGKGAKSGNKLNSNNNYSAKNNAVPDSTNNGLEQQVEVPNNSDISSNTSNSSIKSSSVQNNAQDNSDKKNNFGKKIIGMIAKSMIFQLFLSGGLVLVVLFIIIFLASSTGVAYADSYNEDAYWWPIGSDSTTLLGGGYYAIDTPHTTTITSNYGPRVAPTPGASTYHNGIDIAPYGSDPMNVPGQINIIASKSGIVKIAGVYGGYGTAVIIEHDDGNYTLYGHLDSATVSYGDNVGQGQVIGKMGNSGIGTTAIHLHFEIRIEKNSSDASADPLKYVSIDEPRPVSESSASGSFSLTKTGLSRTEFVTLMEAYSYNDAYNTNFKNKAGSIYDSSRQYGINPELVVVSAQTEMSYKKCGEWYNFWGLGISNGQGCNDGYHFNSIEAGIKKYASLMQEYSTRGTSFYKQIIARTKERKNNNCDPAGYGVPDSVQGMQSIYSWLGNRWDSATCSIMKNNFMGTNFKPETYNEAYYNKKCNGNSTAATTVCEQTDYTAYQVRDKVNLRKKIFKIGE